MAMMDPAVADLLAAIRDALAGMADWRAVSVAVAATDASTTATPAPRRTGCGGSSPSGPSRHAAGRSSPEKRRTPPVRSSGGVLVFRRRSGPVAEATRHPAFAPRATPESRRGDVDASHHHSSRDVGQDPETEIVGACRTHPSPPEGAALAGWPV